MSEQGAGTTGTAGDATGYPATGAAAGSAGTGRGRGIAAVVCFVLAALLTLPGAVAYWGQRTINDSQRYIDTVGPLIESPEVQAAIATKATEAIQQQVDVEAIITEVFSGVIADRPRLQQLVGPLSGAVNGLIANTVQTLVASDAFASLWIEANTRAQQRLHALLNGEDTGAVQIQGDQVVLDLGDVIAAAKQRLVDRGLTFLQNVPVPDVDRQIVLLTAPQVDQLMTMYAFTNPVATWLIWIVFGLYLLAFVLAARRPRMTVAIGVSLAANALLLAFGLSVVRQLFVNELSGTVFGPAAAIFWDTLLAFLIRGWQVFLWLGIILIVVGWFAGRTASAAAVRGGTGRLLETPGRALADGPLGGTGRWVAGNAFWLRALAVVIGFVVLLWGVSVTVERLVWSTVLVVVLFAVIQVLVGAGRGPAPAPGTAAEVEGARTAA